MRRDLDGRRLTRRGFLAASGGAAGAAGVLALPAAARAQLRRSSAFAVIADSHVDPYSPAHAGNLQAVLDHIAARPTQPAFVFHVGDVVESGLPAEYEAYDQVVPPALASRISAVPGNHEVRWDEWAGELYVARFGQSPFSFDAAGVHVVALDPTQLLQEPGYFSDAHLDWLRSDLRRAGSRTPTVAFVHYPMGGDHFYVGNQGELLDVLEGSGVRAVFAGHIHREEVVRQQGLTQITLPAILRGVVYHWAERGRDAAGREVLTVSRWERTAGVWAATPVAVAPLDGREATPVQRVDLDGAGGALAVRLRHRAAAARVRGRIYPEATWGGASTAGWVELAPSGPREWTGALDLGPLAAGAYRLQVQIRDAADARWEAVRRVEVDKPTPLREAWAQEAGGSVQAGLAALPDGAVLAATDTGEVVAIDGPRGHGHGRWRAARARGPILGAPLVTPDGRRVVVPDASGAVRALDARDGSTAWTFTAPRPALGSPAWAARDARDASVIVAAGRALHRLDAATGAVRWTADVGGLVAGRPVADETGVFAGAGDGRAHAFDLDTGARRWSFVMSSRGTPYRDLIYGPWAARAALLPGDRVLIATVSGASALDRATGARAWELRGGYMYNAPLLLGDRLVLVNEWGEAAGVDALTGAVQWRTQLPQRVLGGAPTAWGGDVAVVGVHGLVAVLDPATGEDRGRLHAGIDYTYAAPVALDERRLAIAGQDGVVRMIAR